MLRTVNSAGQKTKSVSFMYLCIVFNVVRYLVVYCSLMSIVMFVYVVEPSTNIYINEFKAY